jgi:hypothetical protein
VTSLEEKMVARDLAGIRTAFRLLPKRRLKVDWDDRNVPPEQRFEFAASRDAAFLVVRKGIEMTFSLAKTPAEADIKISFERALGEDPVSHKQRAVATFYHTEAGQAPFEAVIGLKRNHKAAKPIDVQNDVTYALTGYFGVAKNELPGAAMNRTDAPATYNATGSTLELSITEYNLEALDDLHMIETSLEARDHHKDPPGVTFDLQPTLPEAFIEPKKLVTTTPGEQGHPLDFQIQVTNSGNSPLNTKLIPDCGCFLADREIRINAGDTAIYRVRMDTSQYGGHINKKLYLLTNDAQQPVIEVPVSVDIAPRYRFLTPAGTVVVVEKETGKLDIFLAVEGNPINVTAARVEQIPGEAEIEPWSGTLPDPDLNEGAMPRKGYHVRVNVGENLLPGRQAFSLVLDTDDKNLPKLNLALFAQKGIAVLPEQEIYFGQLTTPTAAKLTLSRPNHGFHVLKVRSTNPHFVATDLVSQKGTEHAMTVKYDGNADAGILKATLIITTDDPAQRLIKVPMSGTVH